MLFVRPIDVEEFHPGPLRRRDARLRQHHRVHVENMFRPPVQVQRLQFHQGRRIIFIVKPGLAAAIGRRRRGIDQPDLVLRAPAPKHQRQVEIVIEYHIGIAFDRGRRSTHMEDRVELSAEFRQPVGQALGRHDTGNRMFLDIAGLFRHVQPVADINRRRRPLAQRGNKVRTDKPRTAGHQDHNLLRSLTRSPL